MNKLIQELQRLYFLPNNQRFCRLADEEGANASQAEALLADSGIADSLAGKREVALQLVSAQYQVRTMIVGFARAADWSHVANLCQAIQGELELPVPAISVSPENGFQVWLSLAEPVAVAQAAAFLNALHNNYLSEVLRSKLTLQPGAANSDGVVLLVPSYRPVSQKWSAFIDPSMGSMFSDELGLDMAPNLDRQADMLTGLKSISTSDFQRALSLLTADAAADADGGQPINVVEQPSTPELIPGINFTDPKTFLLAVMNDPSASVGDRVRAAEALLPYFERLPKG